MRLRMNDWVICGRCGAPLGEGYRFCGGCGAAVGTCPSCSEPLTPGERFCHSCGYALADHPPGAAAVKTAAGPVAMASEPVAERRVCSVLFCDLVGFTPLSEARDPEAVRELLSHTAGVTVHGFPGYAAGTPVPTLLQVLDGTPPANTDPLSPTRPRATAWR